MLQIKLIINGQLAAEIFMFERVDGRTHGRRLDSHPISLPCEPSAQVSYKWDKTKMAFVGMTLSSVFRKIFANCDKRLMNHFIIG